MNYTQSDANIVDGLTGYRSHQDSAPIATEVSADDMNQLTWGVMEIVNLSGLAPRQFDRLDPSSYKVLLKALQKMRGHTSVVDHGAKFAPTDDSGAFQLAIDSLSLAGGSIDVPAGTYLLNTEPNWGAKSIEWIISPGAKFTGTATVGNGSFPRAETNISMLPVGRFIQSRSAITSTPENAVGVDVIDVIQPAGMNGGTVGQYVGIKGDNSGSNTNLWAANFLVRTGPNSTGGAQGLEIDVDSFGLNAQHIGLNITGLGTVNPDLGIIVQRANASFWKVGFEVRSVEVGISIPGNGLSRGIVINSPAVIGGAILSAKQLGNGSRAIFLQRNTDIAPTGKYLQFVNAVDTEELFSVDVLGNAVAAGELILGGALTIKGAPSSTFVDALSIGGAAINSATSGPTAVPSQCFTFIKAWLGSVEGRIPFYRA